MRDLGELEEMLAAEISEAKPQPEVRQQPRSVAVPALEPEPGTGKESEADAVPGSDAALRELGELEDMLTESESDLTSSSDDEVEFETEPEPERMRIDGPTMPEQSQQLRRRRLSMGSSSRTESALLSAYGRLLKPSARSLDPRSLAPGCTATATLYRAASWP